MEIPGFSSAQLDLLVPLSPLCCTNQGAVLPASAQERGENPSFKCKSRPGAELPALHTARYQLCHPKNILTVPVAILNVL